MQERKIDYSPHPDFKKVPPLRSAVKAALGHIFAAPEILYHLLSKESLDPECRWLLASLGLVHAMISLPQGQDFVRQAPQRKVRSRFSALVNELEDYGWDLGPAHIVCPDKISLTLVGPELRDRVTVTYRRMCFMRLASRRPRIYLGLKDANSVEHAKYLKSLTSYQASTITRVWTGCAMTLAHRKTVDDSIADCCPCGEGIQDVPHLAYACALTPPLPTHLVAWSKLAPPQSVACLCPQPASSDMIHLWRQACFHVMTALSSKPNVLPLFDWKNHVIAIDTSLTCAYCIRCIVARTVKDQKYIESRPCAGEIMGHTLSEGECTMMRGHLFRCTIVPWRRSTPRPVRTCSKCAATFWPSALPPVPCVV